MNKNILKISLGSFIFVITIICAGILFSLNFLVILLFLLVEIIAVIRDWVPLDTTMWVILGSTAALFLTEIFYSYYLQKDTFFKKAWPNVTVEIYKYLWMFVGIILVVSRVGLPMDNHNAIVIGIGLILCIANTIEVAGHIFLCFKKYREYVFAFFQNLDKEAVVASES